MSERTDILVLGGGPSGSVAARSLSALGHAVTLVSRERPGPVYEGISQRSLDGLEFAGCARALAAVGPEVDRLATWNGETTSLNREFIVEKAALDAGLLEDAAGGGARVLAGVARQVRSTAHGWTIAVDTVAGEHIELEGSFLIEARGRQAPLHGERRQVGLATTALVQAWRPADASRAGTAVASFPDGWIWWCAAGDGMAVLQIVVSSAPGELPGRSGLRDFYEDRLREAEPFAPWLEGKSLGGVPMVRNATPAYHPRPVQRRMLRVGDAAVAGDPLSGQGVYAGVGAALAAAAVVNTLLNRPADAGLACRFYRERCEGVFLSHVRIGRDFYAAEQRWSRHPFWAARRCWPDAEPAHEHPHPSAGAALVSTRPVMDDGFVVARRVVVTPDHPRGVWRIADVPVASLLDRLAHTRMASEETDVVALAGEFEVRPDQVKTAVDWLRYRRMLQPVK